MRRMDITDLNDANVTAAATANERISRRLDRCDCVIQNESGDSNGGHV